MTVERASCARLRIAPEVAQQLVLAKDPCRVAGEVREQGVLQTAQVEGEAVDSGLARGGVDQQRADS